MKKKAQKIGNQKLRINQTDGKINELLLTDMLTMKYIFGFRGTTEIPE